MEHDCTQHNLSSLEVFVVIVIVTKYKMFVGQVKMALHTPATTIFPRSRHKNNEQRCKEQIIFLICVNILVKKKYLH